MGARLGSNSSARHEEAAEARAIAREAREAAAQAERRAEQERQATSRRAQGDMTGAGPGFVADAATHGCTLAAVEETSKRLAKTAAGFRKRSIQEAMLPPEVENLQRVVYSMEV